MRLGEKVSSETNLEATFQVRSILARCGEETLRCGDCWVLLDTSTNPPTAFQAGWDDDDRPTFLLDPFLSEDVIQGELVWVIIPSWVSVPPTD